jgi:hypothetical protein
MELQPVSLAELQVVEGGRINLRQDGPPPKQPTTGGGLATSVQSFGWISDGWGFGWRGISD